MPFPKLLSFTQAATTFVAFPTICRISADAKLYTLIFSVMNTILLQRSSSLGSFLGNSRLGRMEFVFPEIPTREQNL